jgi:hypothetical protein
MRPFPFEPLPTLPVISEETVDGRVKATPLAVHGSTILVRG